MPYRHASHRAKKPRFPLKLIIFILLAAPPSVVIFAMGWLSAVYATIINVITFILYRHDKAQSRIGGWRVSESSLHVCELLGGWPAAFVAQRVFRHKTRKMSYQINYWGIVALHEVLWVDVVTGGAVRKLLKRRGSDRY
jgi:uncharacterized membrane protein YsdA (DUF1294 family)